MRFHNHEWPEWMHDLPENIQECLRSAPDWYYWRPPSGKLIVFLNQSWPRETDYKKLSAIYHALWRHGDGSPKRRRQRW